MQQLNISSLKWVFLFAAIIFLHGCKKEDKNTSPISDPKIEQAKSWYESTYPVQSAANGNLTDKATNSASPNGLDFSQIIKPDWGSPSSYTRLGKDVIEMPIKTDRKFLAEFKNMTSGAVYADKKYNRTYFLLLNDGKNYNAYVMMVMADPDYVKGDLTKLSHNTYRKHDADFSGLVLYFTPKGRYIGGYQYVNGQLVASSANQSSGGKQVLDVKSDKVAIETNCTDYYLITYYDDGTTSSQYLGTTCDGPCNESIQANGCPTGSNPGGGSGSPPPPPTCGGGGGTINQSLKTITAVVVTDGGMPQPNDACAPSSTAGIFGLNNSNTIVTDDNMDDLISFWQGQGYSFSSPLIGQFIYNGVAYPGQFILVFDSNKNEIGRYFSSNTTTGPFQVGLNYYVAEEPVNSIFYTPSAISRDPQLNSFLSFPNSQIVYGSDKVLTDLAVESNPVNAPDDPIINNGMDLTDVSSTSPPGRLIGASVNRNNTEDMQHGIHADKVGIYQSEFLKTDAQLFDTMTDMMHFFSYFDSGMSAVGDLMVQKFRNKEGGTFENAVLNDRVAHSSSLLNVLEQFAGQLNVQLRANSGDLSSVSQITLTKRPIFDGAKNKFNGLTITINDTEYTEIQITDYFIVNGHWSATIDVTIHDHFGLDKNDALTYQKYHLGFPDWWILQHTKNYVPFETIIRVRKGIVGTL